MHVKIIEVIEVTDYAEEVYGDMAKIVPKHSYYLRDGTPLQVIDPFAPQVPAEPKIHVHHHEDGSVSASTIGSH